MRCFEFAENMILEMRKSNLFAPVMSLEPTNVVVSSGTTSPDTFLDVSFNKTTGATSTYEYLISGIPPWSVAYESVAGSLDGAALSNGVLRRGTGINEQVTVRIANERAISKDLVLSFADYANFDVYGNVTGITPGSYTDYSQAAVLAVFAGMSTPSIYNPNGTRKTLPTFPHQSDTAHVWGYQNSVALGHRFTAITSRHLIGVGHYSGSEIGRSVTFLTADNQQVTRSIVGEINLLNETNNFDLSIQLLSSDLPASITPMPIVGDWFYRMSNHTPQSYDNSRQVCGIVLWNNGGEATPWHFVSIGVQNVARPYSLPYVWEGFQINAGDVLRNPDPPGNSERMPDLSALNSTFVHQGYSGDSGSPVIAPVDGGWALAGFISSFAMPSEALLNHMLDTINSRYSVVGAYSCTVAPDPTL